MANPQATEYAIVAATFLRDCYRSALDFWNTIVDELRRVDTERTQRDVERLDDRTGTLKETTNAREPATSKDLHLDDKKRASIGKFRGLKGFLKNPHPDYGAYTNATVTQLWPGEIVHVVNDAAERHPDLLFPLHERVMLVLQSEGSKAMMCIPFSRRDDERPEPEMKKRFWQVEQTSHDSSARRVHPPSSASRHAEEADQDARFPHPMDHQSSTVYRNIPGEAVDSAQPVTVGSSRLALKLRKGLALDTEVVLNMEELCRVEYREISFRVIGWIHDDSLGVVANEVKAIMCSWLDRLIPDEQKPAADLDDENIIVVPVKRKDPDKDHRRRKSVTRRI
jgi:hypothetical protein